MTEYTDLNKIVQGYNISNKNDSQELLELQKRISDVPVSLAPFEKYLKERNLDFSSLAMRAEFYDSQMREVLLDGLVERDKAYKLIERMILPYPKIIMDGSPISSDFYMHLQRNLGRLILPDKRDETAKVLSNRRCRGVAVIYERENRVHYLEMTFNGDYR
jgi:hypothetical protein